MGIFDLTLPDIRGFALWATQDRAGLPPEVAVTRCDVSYPWYISEYLCEPSHRVERHGYAEIVLDGEGWAPFHLACLEAGSPEEVCCIMASFGSGDAVLSVKRDGEESSAPLCFALLRLDGEPIVEFEFNTWQDHMGGYGRCNNEPTSLHTDGVDRALALLNASAPRSFLRFVKEHAGASG